MKQRVKIIVSLAYTAIFVVLVSSGALRAENADTATPFCKQLTAQVQID